MTTPNVNAQVFTHEIKGLGDINKLLKIYQALVREQNKLGDAAGKLNDKTRNIVLFKGLDEQGNNIKLRIKEINGVIKDFVSEITAAKAPVRREIEVLKELDAQGIQTTQTIEKLNDVVSQTKSVVVGPRPTTFKDTTVSFDPITGAKTTKEMERIGDRLAKVTSRTEEARVAGHRFVSTLNTINAAGQRVSTTETKLNGVLQLTKQTVSDIPAPISRVTSVLKSFNAQGQQVIRTVERLSNRLENTKEVISDLANQPIRLTNSFKSLNAEGQIVTTRQKFLNGALVDTNETINAMPKAMENAQKSTNRLGKAFNNLQLVRGILIGSAVSRAFAEISNAMRDGIDRAGEYLIKIGELQTISQRMPLSVDQWSQANVRLSNTFNKDLLETVAGSYEVLSNQIAEGAETFRFMAEAQRLAMIAVGSTQEGVNALSSVLNSYNLTQDRSREISNSFFKAVDLGRFTLKDVANDLGGLTILSNDLGVSYQEVFSALAVLTRQGADASTAMTFLRQVFQKLTKPTKEMNELFREWGVTSGQSAVEAFKFVGVLERISEASKRSGDSAAFLNEIMDELRGRIGTTGLVNALGQYKTTLEQVTNSTEEANKATEIMQKNYGTKFQKILKELSNFFTAEIGTKVVKAIVNFEEVTVKAVTVVKASINTLTFAIEFLVANKLVNLAVRAKVAAAAMTAGTVAASRFSIALGAVGAAITRLGPALLVFGAIEGIRRYFAAINDVEFEFGSFTDKFQQLSDIRKDKFEKEMLNMTDNATSGIKVIKQQFTELQAVLTGLNSQIIDMANAQKALTDQIDERSIDILLKENKVFEAQAIAQKKLLESRKQLEAFVDQTKVFGEPEQKALKEFTDDFEDKKQKLEQIQSEIERDGKSHNKAMERLALAERERAQFIVKTGAIDTIAKQQRLEDLNLAISLARRNLAELGGQSGGAQGRFKIFGGRDLGVQQRQQEIPLQKQGNFLLEQEIKVREALQKLKDQATGKKDLSEFRDPKLQAQLAEQGKAADEVIREFSEVGKQAEVSKNKVDELNQFLEQTIVKAQALGAAAKEQGVFDVLKAPVIGGGDDAGLLRAEAAAQKFTEIKTALETLADTNLKPTAENIERVSQALSFIKDRVIPQLKDKTSSIFPGLTPEKFEQFNAEINKLSALVANSEIKTQALRQEQERLEIIKKSLEVSPEVRNLITESSAIAERFTTNRESLKAMLESGELTGKGLLDLNTKVIDAGITTNNILESQFKRLEAAANSAAEALRRAEAIQNSIPFLNRNTPGRFDPVQFQNMGGFITRGFGGSVGKDSQHILADPREFIMNSRSTAKFLPQLVAMNSKAMNTGGPVTNTNIGDVNINITGAETQQIDARTLGNQIRRELRRNTMRLT